jgi:RNA polymerase sigma-70 factor (ECF subfamily)
VTLTTVDEGDQEISSVARSSVTPDEASLGADFFGWYNATFARVVGSLVAYGSSPEDAEDAGNEAFARAFARWSRLSTSASRDGWVFVVALNVLRRAARRHALERSKAPVLSWTVSGSVDDFSDGIVTAMDVIARLNLLPERERLVVMLGEGLDLTQEEVARLLGIRRSTVSSLLSTARKRVAQRGMSTVSVRTGMTQQPCPEASPPSEVYQDDQVT